jgi:hypothetical protein
VFQKPDLLVELGLKQLQREIILPARVWTNPIANFGGSRNDTVNVKINAVLTSRERAFRGTGNDRKVTADDLIEYSFGVTLDNVIYSAVNLTDEQLTLDINSFAQQVLVPQSNAVAYGLEDYVADVITGAPYEETFWLDPTDNYPAILDARQFLNDHFIPDTERTLVVGPTVETAFLKDSQLRHFEKSGDGSNEALRRAEVMNLAGLTVIRSNAIPTDEAYLFHRTAFILANAGPVKPVSVQAGHSLALQGYAARWIADYDYQNLQDRSLLDTYVGNKVVTEKGIFDGQFVRAVKLKLGISGVDAGPDLSVTAAAGANHTAQVKVKDSNGVTRTKEATFASDAEGKATVDGDGKVTGVSAGTANVTATYVNPKTGADVTDTVKVTVS